ncbi:hypothetical protein [Pendulispora albinea]|uniref:Uncharacterized protein n=1 Tax=Pendulispora albinea TaxID=2741071 RepID=A0ABZ2LIY8_9BACT
MAEDPMDEGRQNPIPPPLADDHEDVSWALSTAQSTWERGEHTDALKWLRRAVEAASEAEADDRALTLAKAAADLTTRIDELGWEVSSVRPGAPTITVPDTPNVAKPTVRLSPLVPPPPPPSGPTAPVGHLSARPQVPPAPPAPSPRAFRPSPPSGPSAEPVASSSSPISSPSSPIAAAGQRAAVSTRSTGSSLLGSSAGTTTASGTAKPTRPKHASLGLLGPRPATQREGVENGSSGPGVPRPSQPTRPPLPPRPASRPPVYRESSTSAAPPPVAARPPVSREATTSAVPPAPPPPPAPPRLEAPAVIEAISSKNLVSLNLPQTPSAEPFPLAMRAEEPAPPEARTEPRAPDAFETTRTTRPAGAWDDGADDGAFAPTPVYPSGPESITFVGPSQIPPPLEDGSAAGAASLSKEDEDKEEDIEEGRGARLPEASAEDEARTAPPTSSPSLENTWSPLRSPGFRGAEDIESWPTEAIPGHALPNFNVEDSTKTRVGTPAYRDEAISASSQPATTHRLHDAESRIAARGPVQKPSQAVRVVVWRGPDGVHVAPHGTTVTAISVDALLVALDPSADLFAWLTNK